MQHHLAAVVVRNAVYDLCILHLRNTAIHRHSAEDVERCTRRLTQYLCQIFTEGKANRTCHRFPDRAVECIGHDLCVLQQPLSSEPNFDEWNLRGVETQ